MPIAISAPRVPSYRRHKPSGQAVVTLDGRDIYLGNWNTKASAIRREHLRKLAAWPKGLGWMGLRTKTTFDAGRPPRQAGCDGMAFAPLR